MPALANASLSFLGSNLTDASLLHQSFASYATSRRAPSRLTYALEQRQVCSDAGSSPCQGFPQNCCPTGANCCEYGGVITGCCPSGSQCAFDGFGNQVCITGSCASQGRVQCTNFQACCPAGSDCLDVGGALKCAPPQAPPSQSQPASPPPSQRAFPPLSSSPTSSSPPSPPPSAPSPSPPPPSSPSPTSSPPSSPSLPQPPQSPPQSQPQPQPEPSPPPSSPSSPPPPPDPAPSPPDSDPSPSDPAPSPPDTPTPTPDPAPTPATSNDEATADPQGDNAPASSFPVSTVRSAPASQQSQPSSLFQLTSCSPCGSQKCTFNPEEDPTTIIYTVTVGTPVENCDGTEGNLTFTVGGSTTFEDSWSVEVEDLGLDFEGVSAGVTTTWGQTKGLEYQQSVQVDVAPGFMSVLVAKVQYKQTSGSISIGSDPRLPILSNQPLKVVAYGAQTTTCLGKFNAASNISSPQCSSAVTAKRLGSIQVALLWSLFLTFVVTSILL